MLAQVRWQAFENGPKIEMAEVRRGKNAGGICWEMLGPAHVQFKIISQNKMRKISGGILGGTKKSRLKKLEALEVMHVDGLTARWLRRRHS